MFLCKLSEPTRRMVIAMIGFSVLATIYYKLHPLISVLLFVLYSEATIMYYDNHKSEFWKKITAYSMCFIYLFLSSLPRL